MTDAQPPIHSPSLEQLQAGGQTQQKELARHRPHLYEVLLLNDDFTPMDFVVDVLQGIFHKNEDEAVAIMLQTHNQGQGKCGVFTRDVAETKMMQVTQLAREKQHPLRCVIFKQ